ncbi:DUF488 domain-containing protein [Gilvimarinus agarilyticus]|uniref:DUF488 domain-containing protein n=1 Tax=Gilvimarinus agarilyticus TaxID=679259 RepID=UPI0005A09CFA|nr:DUF488 family protein [Gilvimarinus agarilyticus]
MKPVVAIKRAYDSPSQQDGIRILVDRLWPRGRQRDELEIDDWYQDAAPSSGLRQCWHRDELTPEAFGHAYRHELHSNPQCLTPLLRHTRNGTLTLLTASRDPAKSHLPILRQCLVEAIDEEDQQFQSEASSPTCYRGATKP